MKPTKTLFSTLLLLLLSTPIFAQNVERERPQEWEGIVFGGRFMDRFLPIKGTQLSSDVWGCEAVKPRYIDNGIEDEFQSYWGGNILKEDGQYHLFVCAWLENSPAGHQAWKNSIIYHTISDKLEGPYTLSDVVGFGHNPEIYVTKDGTYMLPTSIQWQPHYYYAKSIYGPWKCEKFLMDTRDRKLIEGSSNLSFTKREDGSMLMVCRGGGIWVSETGMSSYNQITNGTVYPPREGAFEDPVIWRDSTQYHLIVNDWLGRVAYYMRSKDGVNWIEDAGEAYLPGIAVHEDGTVEDWYKFERIKIFQDEQGRAIQTNFAVNDTLKNEDLGNDNHSSKNITIPLNKGLLMEITNPKIEKRMSTITVLVKGEADFNPQTDLDIESLRFGCSMDINYGKGCAVKSTKASGDDLLITFNTRGYQIPDSEFAPKLMGKDLSGNLVYGYARNPNVDFTPAVLSSRKPVQEGEDVALLVENFGVKPSTNATLHFEVDGVVVAKESIAPIKPYGKTSVTIQNVKLAKGSTYRIQIVGENVVQLDDKFTL